MWYLGAPQTRPTGIGAVFGGAPRPFPVLTRAPTSPAARQGANQTQGMRRIRAQSTGKGWEPGRPPLCRAQLNPLLVPPSQQLHPRGLLLPGSAAAAAPLGDRGTQRWPGPQSVGLEESFVSPQSPGAHTPPASPCPHRSPCCSPHCCIPGTQHSTVGCVPVPWGRGQHGSRDDALG